ncbi:MAG: helix-turn-helix domain-containing protein [Novosphingobium sp.]|nr:helix-turn-helix domain-containing protein [Novosphingobium sp.]
MATPSVSTNKAKIARRVVEVLDYFDDNHCEATVMDIVRRYDRPQSSTSELLCSMVELGLLYKDPYSRSYSLSPRAALLGQAGQPDVIRDGRLMRLLDRLVAQTGLSVALFGMVGLNTQIISWRPGPRTSPAVKRDLSGGLQEPLSQSAPGWLLLSTVAQPRCDGLVRRLNAEASDDRKFSLPEMAARLQACRVDGNVQGPVGYNTKAEVLGVLLPDQQRDRPLAVGFVYGAEEKVNVAGLLQCLEEAMHQCLDETGATTAEVERLPNAA